MDKKMLLVSLITNIDIYVIKKTVFSIKSESLQESLLISIVFFYMYFYKTFVSQILLKHGNFYYI